MCKFFKTNVLFKYYMLAAFHIIPYYFSKIKLFLGKLKKKKKCPLNIVWFQTFSLR